MRYEHSQEIRLTTNLAGKKYVPMNFFFCFKNITYTEEG